MRLFIAGLAITAAALLLSGCNTVRLDPRGLSTRLESVCLADGARPALHCKVRLVNESVLGYVIARSEHRVFINGIEAGTGVSEAATGIRQLDTVLQDVVIDPVDGAVVTALRAVPDGGTVGYRIESMLRLRQEDRRGRWETEQSGTAAVMVEPAR